MYTGLGAGTGIAVEQTIGGAASVAVPTLLVSQGVIGSVAAGSLAVPVIGAAIAAVTAVVGIFMARAAKYHAQEAATTQIVDQAEQLMKQNLAAWQASNKTQSEQAQAEANFQNIWTQVVNACSNPQFEDPGKRCIADRSRSGQWDWFSYYLDPIANDPNVQPDPVQGAVSGVTSAVEGAFQSGSPVPLLLAAGLALWAVS